MIGAGGDDDLGSSAGAAFVFEYDGTSWVQQQKLLASDGTSIDTFGASAALLGDTILIGAPGADGLLATAGAAYVFRFDGKQWVEEQKLVADDMRGFQENFGWSVSLSSFGGGTALVGAHRDSDAGPGNGSAYIFNYNGTKWVQTQELFAPDAPPTGELQFGRSLSIDGERLVIGAHHASVTGINDGAAYVFRYDNDSAQWVFQEQLLPEAIASTSFFGYSVAISGGTVVCGAYGEFSQSGRAYVFNVDPPGGTDLDCDGAVGPDDLAELLAQWGACPPPEEGECSADIAPPDALDGIVGRRPRRAAGELGLNRTSISALDRVMVSA